MNTTINFSIILFVFLALIIISQQTQIQQEEQRREQLTVNEDINNFVAKLNKKKRFLSTSERLTGKSAFLNRRLHKREADPMEEQSCVVRVQKVCLKLKMRGFGNILKKFLKEKRIFN